MTTAQRRATSARFILTYRREKPDVPTGDAEWRGWVARVPDADETRTTGEPNQKWFGSLAQLPEIIRGMLGEEDQGPNRKKELR